MSDREELAAESLWGSICDDLPESFWEASFWRGDDWTTGRLDVADRKRITLALARVIREREFEGIKAVNLRAIKHELETPSRGHGECCGQTEESLADRG